MRKSKLSQLLIALAIVVALAGFGHASAQSNIVGRGQAVATIRGSLVLIADNTAIYAVDARTQQWVHRLDYGNNILDLGFDDGYLAVTFETGLVLVENIGVDGEHFGDAKTVGKVPGQFVEATVAGDMLVAIDWQGKVWYINWRSGEAAAPEENHPLYLPVTLKKWDLRCEAGGPNDPCAPTPPVVDPTATPDGPEPPYPPVPTDLPTQEAPPTARISTAGPPPPIGPTVAPRP